MVTSPHFDVRPLSASIGAELTGIDLARPLSEAAVHDIRATWLEHLVVVFRDQDLTPDQYLAFARRLGEPGRYPFVAGIDNYPEIIAVEKLPDERNNFGGIWHTDTAYLPEPPAASMLLAKVVPPEGGDTEFANMYDAYEQLPSALKEQLAPLSARQCSALADVSRTRSDRVAHEPSARQAFEATHPVVRTHPETGRQSLYVNVAHTSHFEGQTPEESRPLLEQLFEHQLRSEFRCRLQWEVGTLVIWDNRCTLHNPLNDYQGHHRLMHRITLNGDRPR